MGVDVEEGACAARRLQHWNLCCCFPLFLNDLQFKNAQTQSTYKHLWKFRDSIVRLPSLSQAETKLPRIR